MSVCSGWSSRVIFPLSGSLNRISSFNIVLLPLPLGLTMPTFSPGATCDLFNFQAIRSHGIGLISGGPKGPGLVIRSSGAVDVSSSVAKPILQYCTSNEMFFSARNETSENAMLPPL